MKGAVTLKRLTFFCLILLISTILPQSNLSAISPSKFSVNENNSKDSYEGKLFSEKIIFNDSLIKYSYDFTDSEKNVVKIKEEGNNSETLVEFYNNTQTLFINGRKDENLKVSTDNTVSTEFTTQAVPKGGSYMGKFNYSYNIKNVTIGLAAASISAVTKAPVSVITAIIAFLAGTSTTLYYTVFQYRYAFKCNAYPYFNHTKFYENSTRKKVMRTAESGKFFSTQPIPASCRP